MLLSFQKSLQIFIGEAWMKRFFIVSMSLLIAIMTVLNWNRHVKAEEECQSAAGFHYVCGPMGVEDFVRVSGTHWIIGSRMGENNGPGKLHLIDTKRKTWETFYPESVTENTLDKKSYPTCTAPPDAMRF